MDIQSLAKEYRTIRRKRLQKLGAALVVMLPKNWLTSLKWSQMTNLIVSYHPDEGKIIILEDPHQDGKLEDKPEEVIVE